MLNHLNFNFGFSISISSCHSCVIIINQRYINFFFFFSYFLLLHKSDVFFLNFLFQLFVFAFSFSLFFHFDLILAPDLNFHTNRNQFESKFSIFNFVFISLSCFGYVNIGILVINIIIYFGLLHLSFNICLKVYKYRLFDPFTILSNEIALEMIFIAFSLELTIKLIH